MELLAAAQGLFFFARDGEDYLLNVNGMYASHTLLLQPDEVARYLEEGTPYIGRLAEHYASHERAAIERQVARRIPAELTRRWRIEQGLPVYDQATNSWVTVPQDEA